MEEVKKYTQEELENLSREEFINVITEITKRNEQLTEELEKQKDSNLYWYKRFEEEQTRQKPLLQSFPSSATLLSRQYQISHSQLLQQNNQQLKNNGRSNQEWH